jgi:hypothetical protein
VAVTPSRPSREWLTSSVQQYGCSVRFSDRQAVFKPTFAAEHALWITTGFAAGLATGHRSMRLHHRSAPAPCPKPDPGRKSAASALWRSRGVPVEDLTTASDNFQRSRARPQTAPVIEN